MVKKKITYIFLNVILFYTVSNAQVYSDAQIKAVYIYQFGLNLEWQNENDLNKFKISVYGNNDELFSYLNKLAQKQTLKEKSIEVINVDNIRELINSKSQIIYVGKSRNYELSTIIKRLKGRNILVVSDNSEQQKIIMINFIYSEDKTIGFEINKNNITNQNLKILPELLLLGGSEIDIKELYKEQELKLKEEKEKVKSLKNELKKQKQLIAELNLEIHKKLLELEQLKKQILLQGKQIEEQKNALLKVDNNINNQKMLLLFEIKELQKKESEIKQKQKIIVEQNDKVEEGKKILEKLSYEISKKQNEIKKQEKELNNQSVKIQKQRNLLIAAGIFVFIILFLSGLLLKNIRLKQKINRKLIYKNIEVVNKNKQIQKQADELEKHRNRLETLVKERTNELQKAKEKAEESDHLKSAFLANMSHEIRTPMNAIIGFSNLLNNKEFNRKKRKELISYIIRGSNTLLHLINDIIDISKIEAGQLNINKKEFFINELFDDLFSVYKEKMKLYKNIELKIIKNDINQNLNTDKLRIQQVLINLIDNSLKFTEKGFVEVVYKIDKVSNEVIFHVKDSGIGITEEQQKNIFNRFIKLEKNDEKLYRGAGLGLSISKHIVELLGGKIWVESELNKGSVFYFTIPFKKNLKINRKMFYQ